MEINQEITEILREFKIGRDAGLLCLLGIYYNLDVDTVVPEETIKAINLTKIIERDYSSNKISIVWNVPLFTGQETAFEWVKDWVEGFGRMNPERKGSYRDAISRMKDFFKKYPQYRKDDIYNARDLYFRGIPGGSKYCMHSHKFIFDGMGAMKKSTLLAYCEKVVTVGNNSNLKGKILE
jgi:hypothetical protein